jgi:hypothetical protein
MDQTLEAMIDWRLTICGSPDIHLIWRVERRFVLNISYRPPMFASTWAYAYPVVPLVTRLFLGIYWTWLMKEVLPEEAQERDGHKTTIVGLAGFSFTAVAGLAVLDSSSRPGLQLSVWYVLVSFIAYVIALNLQTYKQTRWHDHLATGLMEVGSLSLVLTVISLLFGAKFDAWFLYLAATLAIGAWLIDHCVRLYLDVGYFREKDTGLRKKGP